MGIFGDVAKELNLHQQLKDVFETYLNVDIKNVRVLEIGCGQKAAQTALFKADGADITGIDLEIPTYKMNIKTFWRILKKNGMERALKSLGRHILFDRKFFSRLSSKYGTSLPLNDLDIRIMSATDLAFPDDSFDFIFSAWVFEHIDDVPAAVKEINRVLKPTGIAWIGIHLFPSLSGGHHLEWLRPHRFSKHKIPPWDHILDNRFPPNVYLNKLRLEQYREIFYKHLQVLEENITHEGESFLTPEIEKRALQKGYTKEDLLTRYVIFICKKKPS